MEKDRDTAGTVTCGHGDIQGERDSVPQFSSCENLGSSQASPCLSFPCDRIQGRARRVSPSLHDPHEIPGVSASLRSRWIIQVSAGMSVEPAAVSVTRQNCQRSGSSAVCLRARICFRAETRTHSPLDMDIGECWRWAGLQGPCCILGASLAVPGASQKRPKGSWSVLGTSQGIAYQSISGCLERIPGWDPWRTLGAFQEHSRSISGCRGEFLEHLWSILTALDHHRALLEDCNIPTTSQKHPTAIPLIFPERISGDPGPPLEHPRVALESLRSILEYQQSTHILGAPPEPATTSWRTSEPSLAPACATQHVPGASPEFPGASPGEVSRSLTRSLSPRSPVQRVPGGAGPGIPSCL